jgi:hypothetical protein
MPGLLDLVRREWKLVSSGPATVLSFVVLSAALGFGTAKLIYTAVVDAARERAVGAREEVERLKAQKELLLKDMGKHGEDIGELRKQLDALPKIRVSNRPPGPDDKPRDDNLWILV